MTRWVPLFAGLSLFVSACATPLNFQASDVQSPFYVAADNQDVVWERVVDVIHSQHFAIARENRLDGVIETDYKVGSGVLEPWHRDSVGLENKLESSLQSIRRKLFVQITPAEGGFLIDVEVFKELEDLEEESTNSSGRSTFEESQPLNRSLNREAGQQAPSGWIALGRDTALEQNLLWHLNSHLGQ